MLSKDGKLLYAVTGSPRADDKMRIWDLATGALKHTLAETRSINHLAMSPDGTRFLAVAGNGKIVMWDAKTNTPLKTFSANKEAISAAAWAQDGKRFVTGSEDKHVRLWHADSGEMLWDSAGHAGPIRGIAFMPGDQQILSGDERGRILLWDVAKGTSTGFPEIENRLHSLQFVMPLADGKRILVCSDQVGIWDLATQKEVVRFDGHKFGSLCADISPDGKYVITGAYDWRARLFDAKTGKLIENVPSHDGFVWVVKFAPDSRTFFSAAGGVDNGKNTFALPAGADLRVYVWRFDPDAPIAVDVYDAPGVKLAVPSK